jgi:hypothetical protein
LSKLQLQDIAAQPFRALRTRQFDHSSMRNPQVIDIKRLATNPRRGLRMDAQSSKLFCSNELKSVLARFAQMNDDSGVSAA